MIDSVPVIPGGTVIDGVPMDSGTIIDSGTVIESPPMGMGTAPMDMGGMSPEPMGTTPSPSDMAPPTPGDLGDGEAPPAANEVLDDSATEPSDFDKPGDMPADGDDNPFGAPADAPAGDAPAADVPAAQPPAMDPPGTDAFGAPAGDAFGAPETDPFGAPAGDAPADTPMTPPAGDDGLFSDPPTDTGTDDGLFGDTPPAGGDSGMDDVFGGGDASSTPADNTPPPAGDDGGGVFGDAFGGGDADPFGAPAMDDPPATPPATGDNDPLFDDPAGDASPDAGSLDGIFNDSGSNDSMPSDDAVESLFDSPERDSSKDTPASTKPSADEVLDELFSSQELPSPAAAEVAAELPAPVQSLEIQRQLVSVADPLAETHQRTWIDNTNTFSTQGRLVEIRDDSVRLFKANGRYCTVPNERMSEADRAYVDSIRKRLPQTEFAMLIGK